MAPPSIALPASGEGEESNVSRLNQEQDSDSAVIERLLGMVERASERQAEAIEKLGSKFDKFAIAVLVYGVVIVALALGAPFAMKGFGLEINTTSSQGQGE